VSARNKHNEREGRTQTKTNHGHTQAHTCSTERDRERQRHMHTTSVYGTRMANGLRMTSARVARSVPLGSASSGGLCGGGHPGGAAADVSAPQPLDAGVIAARRQIPRRA
jgi:hypothetical protein